LARAGDSTPGNRHAFADGHAHIHKYAKGDANADTLQHAKGDADENAVEQMFLTITTLSFTTNGSRVILDSNFPPQK